MKRIFVQYFLTLVLQAFTTDFRVHWAQHPLRPEFIESTYFLHKVQKSIVLFKFESPSSLWLVSRRSLVFPKRPSLPLASKAGQFCCASGDVGPVLPARGAHGDREPGGACARPVRLRRAQRRHVQQEGGPVSRVYCCFVLRKVLLNSGDAGENGKRTGRLDACQVQKQPTNEQTQRMRARTHTHTQTDRQTHTHTPTHTHIHTHTHPHTHTRARARARISVLQCQH